MLFSPGPARANPTPSKIGNSAVLVLYCCLRGTPKPNGLKQQLTFPHDSWVSSAQQVLLLFHVTSAGVAQATAVSWEFDWSGTSQMASFIHVSGSWLASCWLSCLCCPPLGLSLQQDSLDFSPGSSIQGSKNRSCQTSKGPAQMPHGNTSTAFHRPKQVTRPAQVQGEGKWTHSAFFSMGGIAGGQFCRQSAGCHHSPCIWSPPGSTGHVASQVPDRPKVLSSKPSLHR